MGIFTYCVKTGSISDDTTNDRLVSICGSFSCTIYSARLQEKLPQFSKGGRFIWLVLIGVAGLAGNFFLFNSSLNFIDPSSAQIFIHFSSFGMLICGIFVFKEKLGLHQKIGLGLLLAGLVFFLQ